MKLIEKKNQFRRDFNGIYKCENCGNVEERKGCYDDANFHINVTPRWKCIKCGESTINLGLVPEKVQTKYPEWQHV